MIVHDPSNERDPYDLWLLAQACDHVSRFHGRAGAQHLWRLMGGPELPQPGSIAPTQPASDEEAATLRLVLDFIDARCVRDPRARVQAGELHRAYCRWAADTKAPILTPTRFGLLMRLTEHPKRNGRVVVYHGLRPADRQDGTEAFA